MDALGRVIAVDEVGQAGANVGIGLGGYPTRASTTPSSTEAMERIGGGAFASTDRLAARAATWGGDQEPPGGCSLASPT